VKKIKLVNIWQSYKQERGCVKHFVRLANTLLKDDESVSLRKLSPTLATAHYSCPDSAIGLVAQYELSGYVKSG